MKKITSNYFILIALALLFAAPGITAYWFYQHPDWLGTSRINKGTLLTPPIALRSFELNQSGATNAHAKWNLVLVTTGNCDSLCLKQLDTLARVRLALGRRLYEVDQWVLLDNQEGASIKELDTFLRDKDIHVATLSSGDKEALHNTAKNDHVFIVSPQNYAILGYSAKGTPDDVYKDLKYLLNTTQQKGH